MNEFNVIIVMNEAMLILLKDKNLNYETNLKIKKYLEDETIFFRIDKENAYEILRSVGVKDDMLDNVYKKLVSHKMFSNLVRRGKIIPDDEGLIIRYNSNSSFSK